MPWPFIEEPSSAGSGGVVVDEVILTLPDGCPAGTAIHVQTGVYAGGGPAAVEGATLTLDAFTPNTSILVNGQAVKLTDDVTRVSATQLSFSVDLKADDQIKVRQYAP